MFARRAYISKMVQPFSPMDFNSLFLKASQFNESIDVTGFLYCGEEHFVQFLEGPMAPLDDLMDRIHRDPRHEMLHTHQYEEADERLFGSWFLRQYPVRHEISNILAAPIFLTTVIGRTPTVSTDFHKTTMLEACELISELNDFWVDAEPAQRTGSAG